MNWQINSSQCQGSSRMSAFSPVSWGNFINQRPLLDKSLYSLHNPLASQTRVTCPFCVSKQLTDSLLTCISRPSWPHGWKWQASGQAPTHNRPPIQWRRRQPPDLVPPKVWLLAVPSSSHGPKWMKPSSSRPFSSPWLVSRWFRSRVWLSSVISFRPCCCYSHVRSLSAFARFRPMAASSLQESSAALRPSSSSSGDPCEPWFLFSRQAQVWRHSRLGSKSSNMSVWNWFLWLFWSQYRSSFRERKLQELLDVILSVKFITMIWNFRGWVLSVFCLEGVWSIPIYGRQSTSWLGKRLAIPCFCVSIAAAK